jgi:hypothetical protein
MWRFDWQQLIGTTGAVAKEDAMVELVKEGAAGTA